MILPDNIQKLNNFIQLHKIKVLGVEKYLDYPGYNICLVQVSINKERFRIYVLDEFKDLEYNNSTLTILLVLIELAMIDDSDNYYHWCKLQAIPYEEHFLYYYKYITPLVKTIKALYPDNEINYYISDMDFQLNSGEMQYLRQKK